MKITTKMLDAAIKCNSFKESECRTRLCKKLPIKFFYASYKVVLLGGARTTLILIEGCCSACLNRLRSTPGEAEFYELSAKELFYIKINV